MKIIIILVLLLGIVSCGGEKQAEYVIDKDKVTFKITDSDISYSEGEILVVKAEVHNYCGYDINIKTEYPFFTLSMDSPDGTSEMIYFYSTGNKTFHVKNNEKKDITIEFEMNDEYRLRESGVI